MPDQPQRGPDKVTPGQADKPNGDSDLRAVTAASGELTATGTLVKGGSRVAFSEGVVVDGSGTPVATATSTCLVFDVPQPRG